MTSAANLQDRDGLPAGMVEKFAPVKSLSRKQQGGGCMTIQKSENFDELVQLPLIMDTSSMNPRDIYSVDPNLWVMAAPRVLLIRIPQCLT